MNRQTRKRGGRGYIDSIALLPYCRIGSREMVAARMASLPGGSRCYYVQCCSSTETKKQQRGEILYPAPFGYLPRVAPWWPWSPGAGNRRITNVSIDRLEYRRSRMWNRDGNADTGMWNSWSSLGQRLIPYRRCGRGRRDRHSART